MTMPPPLRKLTLATHLTLSVGWIGAVAAYLALDVATSQDPQTLQAAYLGMDLIVRYVIVPLALASLLTGLVMAMGTRWGLFRHYWVLISLLLTIVATVVLLDSMQAISDFAATAAAPTTSAAELRELPSTLVRSIGGMVVLLVILVLNVYKPQGMTRYGRATAATAGADPARPAAPGARAVGPAAPAACRDRAPVQGVRTWWSGYPRTWSRVRSATAHRCRADRRSQPAGMLSRSGRSRTLAACCASSRVAGVRAGPARGPATDDMSGERGSSCRRPSWPMQWRPHRWPAAAPRRHCG
jgi:hypothetical protein